MQKAFVIPKAEKRKAPPPEEPKPSTSSQPADCGSSDYLPKEKHRAIEAMDVPDFFGDDSEPPAVPIVPEKVAPVPQMLPVDEGKPLDLPVAGLMPMEKGRKAAAVEPPPVPVVPPVPAPVPEAAPVPSSSHHSSSSHKHFGVASIFNIRHIGIDWFSWRDIRFTNMEAWETVVSNHRAHLVWMEGGAAGVQPDSNTSTVRVKSFLI